MAKYKNKNKMFDKLKNILIHSGYRVILTKKIEKDSHAGLSRGIKGYILPDQLQIFINKSFRVNDRVVTLIHELLHEIYPSKTENQVDKMSKTIFSDLNVSQLGFLQFFIMSPVEIRSTLKANQHNA